MIMASNYTKTVGIVIAIAAIEIVLAVLFAQHLYPNYSLNNNYISDLGVGSTAIIFNTGIQLFGIILLIAAYLFFKSNRKYLALGFAIAALGGIGVGTFPETTGAPHIISALITFGSIAILCLAFSRIFKRPLAYYSLLAGILALGVLLLSVLNMVGIHVNVGLGKGGVEEILFYDEILWSLVVGLSFFKGKI